MNKVGIFKEKKEFNTFEALKKKWQSCTSQTDKQSPNHIEPNRQ